MPYSGADVLAHISELARQRAELPRIAHIVVVSRQEATGNVIQSALRAVVGYETDIRVYRSVSEAGRGLSNPAPEIAFLSDDKTMSLDWCRLTLQSLRKGGLQCPVVFILDTISPQLSSQLFELGALDVFHRDEICGLNLRQSLLKLADPEHTRS